MSKKLRDTRRVLAGMPEQAAEEPKKEARKGKGRGELSDGMLAVALGMAGLTPTGRRVSAQPEPQSLPMSGEESVYQPFIDQLLYGTRLGHERTLYGPRRSSMGGGNLQQLPRDVAIDLEASQGGLFMVDSLGGYTRVAAVHDSIYAELSSGGPLRAEELVVPRADLSSFGRVMSAAARREGWNYERPAPGTNIGLSTEDRRELFRRMETCVPAEYRAYECHYLGVGRARCVVVLAAAPEVQENVRPASGFLFSAIPFNERHFRFLQCGSISEERLLHAFWGVYQRHCDAMVRR